MSNELKKVVESYFPYGITWGVEFLLPPEKAIALVDDLAKHNVLIYGCDLWRFLEPDKSLNSIVALIGAGMLVEDPEPPDVETANGNAEKIKDFIKNQLPEDAELVSLIYPDHETYELFRR